MEKEAHYILEVEDEDRTITVKPHNQPIFGGDLYSTGVYSLTEGVVGLGDIVFDDDMQQWEYTGLGGLTHEQVEKIAMFIKNHS